MTTRERILLTLLILRGKSTYKRVFGFMPPGYKQGNYYGILRRMEKDGFIKRIYPGRARPDRVNASRNPLLRIEPQGLQWLTGRLGPKVKQLLVTAADRSLNWDKKWRLVVYDFPLNMSYRRSRLQTRLSELGFGPLRRGVYLSPFVALQSVAGWAEENNLINRLILFEASAGDNPSLAVRAWDLSGLAKDYFSILDRIAIVRGQQDTEKKIAGLKRIRSDFLQIVVRDPYLPKELLPADWPFKRVREVIKSID